jgi:hypothetical protein
MHSHIHLDVEQNRVQCLAPLINMGKMTEFDARCTTSGEAALKLQKLTQLILAGHISVIDTKLLDMNTVIRLETFTPAILKGEISVHNAKYKDPVVVTPVVVYSGTIFNKPHHDHHHHGDHHHHDHKHHRHG